MHYKLLGFTHNGSARHFVFQRVAGLGTVSVTFTVVADLTLARQFKMALQDLPSICSRLLETGADDQPGGTRFLTEADMRLYAEARLAAAQKDEAGRTLRSRRGTLAAATTDTSAASPSAAAAPRAPAVNS